VIAAVAEQSQDQEIKEAIRKADSYLNAATRLVDAEEELRARGENANHMEDDSTAIREFVIPMLEAEAAKAGQEVKRLKGGYH
jgi:hypothetical protein